MGPGGPPADAGHHLTEPSAQVVGRPRLGEHGYVVRRALRRALAVEAARAPAGVVLDVGCGSKPYASLFAGPVIGVDLAAAHGDPDALGVAEALPVRSGAVAVVLSTQHLEHAEDPAAVLRELRRVLGPGGVLLLSTHGTYVHHPDPRDLWRWTEEGLVELVGRHGFEVERVHRQGEVVAAAALLALYPVAAAGAAASRPAARAAGRAAIAAANVAVLGLDRLVARVQPRHLASVGYLVVARVPSG